MYCPACRLYGIFQRSSRTVVVRARARPAALLHKEDFEPPGPEFAAGED
jgi:hypothetical protein